MDTVYNSRSPLCKRPYGAVQSGTKVEVTAFPEAYRLPLRGYLCVDLEGTGEHREIPMQSSPESDGAVPFTAVIDTADYVGLCFYHFRFENEGGFFTYGAPHGRSGGECKFYGCTTPHPYQLTVYGAPRVVTPDWYTQGITYQIFPDRFARSGTPDLEMMDKRKRIYHQNWSDNPIAALEDFEGRHQFTARDFFGGNLRGITEKLDYLQSLSVTTIYLNPIFEAFSNHRYDTGDYHKIDPLLGTEEDFTAMCSAAEQRGIRVVLDGVFSHTGSDSIYFNRRGTYTSTGAFQSSASPYYSWYRFQNWPHRYDSWWGVETLPETDEHDPSFRNFITGGDNRDSVVRRWLRAGASGWRIDVSDELPDDFIAEITAAATAEKPDALILGEVWEDASNKIAYSKRRAYILGGMLDGVMGYTFRTALLAFLYGGASCDFVAAMEDIRENYPPQAFAASLNILGTHDTPRIMTLLGSTANERSAVKGNVYLRTPPNRRATAIALQKIASLVQYTFPGTPCLYYGDEAGVDGAEDPFCRRTYPWGDEDAELLEWYKRLGALRSTLQPLKTGSLQYIDTVSDLLCFVRTIDPPTRDTACDNVSTNRDNTCDNPTNQSIACNSASANRDTVPHPTSLITLVNRGNTPHPMPLGLLAGSYRNHLTDEIIVIPSDASTMPTVAPFATLLLQPL